MSVINHLRVIELTALIKAHRAELSAATAIVTSATAKLGAYEAELGTLQPKRGPDGKTLTDVFTGKATEAVAAAAFSEAQTVSLADVQKLIEKHGPEAVHIAVSVKPPAAPAGSAVAESDAPNPAAHQEEPAPPTAAEMEQAAAAERTHQTEAAS
jgi:hypothetical protein